MSGFSFHFFLLSLALTFNLAEALEPPPPTSIEIGLAANFSEPSVSASNPYTNYFRQGIQLALQQREAELLKKKIKINVREFDYGTKPIRVLEVARAAVESSVLGVIGYGLSSQALLAAPIHQKNKLPLLSPSATADRLGTFGDYVHQACFDNSFMSKTLAKLAHKKFKAKKIAIIVAADCAYCQDLAHSFRKEFYLQTHLEPKEIRTLETEHHFSTLVQQVLNYQPDLILLPNQELLSARIIAALNKAGIHKPYLGGDGWGSNGENFHKVLDQQEFQGFSVSHWHEDMNVAASKIFLNQFQKQYGKKPIDTAVMAYDSMNLMIEAILHAPTLTRQGLEEGFKKIKHFEGVTGPFTFKRYHAPEKSLVLLKKEKIGFSAIETLHPKFKN